MVYKQFSNNLILTYEIIPNNIKNTFFTMCFSLKRFFITNAYVYKISYENKNDNNI